MEIFLEFLKYGAIGIAMVLVVLSYRLLSKEQERESVREPMLKSIKTYFILAIVLAGFFGVAEIVSVVIKPSSGNDVLQSKVEGIYDRNLTENDAESIDDKLKIIENFVRIGLQPASNSDCSALQREIELLQKEVKNAKYGNYVEVVMRLQESVISAPNSFINLSHDVENKGTYYELLGQILGSLDLLSDGERNNKSKILEAWVATKKKYAYLADQQKNRAEWIVKSDIGELLKLGHN